ncbi:MAG: hypothetical protein WCC69_07825 [Pirellulales bacterium]
MMRVFAAVAVLVALVATPARAALVTVNDFSDIFFWTGSGTNQAALVLQFPTTVETGTVAPAAIAWGYRWNGSATFADMVFSLAGNITGGPRPVAGSDARLAVDVSYYSAFTDYFVNEVSYNQIGLPAADWSQAVRQIGPYDIDTGEYPAQYQLDSAAGVWTGSQLNVSGAGIAGTPLVDGGWYGFIQADGLASTLAFAQPVAAVPEPAALPLAVCGCVVAVGAWRRRQRVS